jgi:SLOG cluster2
MFQEHLGAALIDISRHLLVRGATLAYGGHLGSTGYTTALFDLVRAHQQQTVMAPVERIVNYAGWPSPLTTQDRAKFRGVATFVRTERPADVVGLDPTFVPEPPSYFPADSKERRFAWARGMTLMREQQTKETDARIAIGGKMGPTYSGRIPGVFEEILLSMEAKNLSTFAALSVAPPRQLLNCCKGGSRTSSGGTIRNEPRIRMTCAACSLRARLRGRTIRIWQPSVLALGWTAFRRSIV